ncbi:MAG TPA: GatB/YqeY domain-containing protein [Candidatus Paceibacterota bacterium]|nr:GatB/YqeY domain-containing protein [Candidatus Paceibacterota bacterium]
MSIQANVKEEIKNAMRAKDQTRLLVLRGMSTAFTNELVSQRKTPQDELDDAAALNVIKRLAKQRKDSIDQFTKGGRSDLAEHEQAELAIIETFLPKMLTRDEIRPVAVAKIAELGVSDKSGLGKLTGAVMKELGANVDGNDVRAVLDELLS